MITFVIPTLWKSPNIFDTIGQFMDLDFPGIEMIVVDNANSDFISEDPRVKIIKQNENIFVNPAWNLGVEIAQNEYVCLLNDDIAVNLRVFIRDLFEKILRVDDNFGMLAINPEGFDFSWVINRDEDQLEPRKINMRGRGFGQLMVFHKSTYEPVPEYFKIFFGDDIQWLVNHNLMNRNNWCFTNLKVVGQFSATSMEYENNGTLHEELKNWDDCVNNLRVKYSK